jgi:hypothetical protein
MMPSHRDRPTTAFGRRLDRMRELRRENADLKRQVTELRAAVDALLKPDGPPLPDSRPDFVSQMRRGTF